MSALLDEIIGTQEEESINKMFRYAPPGWSLSAAREAARAENLEFEETHLELICALQEFFARQGENTPINLLRLHDALEEKFHYKGGLKFLYAIMPKGPVAQGCRLAGLKVPPGAIDSSYGSVA
jgi:tRNA 2-thiouridine synthesizing protein E